MNLSSLMGGSNSEKAKQPKIEYTAQTVSPVVNGEAKLTIGENSFTAATLFDTVEIAFAEINTLSFTDYAITVKIDSGDYTFSHMGQWAQPFYGALCNAYNKAVLRSLFIKSAPILTAKGNYKYSEKNTNGEGPAPVHVYENCVVALPSDATAQRVPLCFVTGIDKGDYELTLSLNTGESYTYAKLGYNTAPFANAVEKQIQTLHRMSLAAIKELNPALTAAQASQLTKIMPQGTAAPFEQISMIAPSFVKALEEKLANTRAAEYYTAFKEVCDPANIYVGFRKNEAGANSCDIAGMLGSLTSDNASVDSEVAEAPPPDPYLLWLIVPSPNEQYAAVEFSDADTATFVYKTGGNFEVFTRQLNRALEAINFKREVIRLSDEELRKPDNIDYYMAVKRTASLQFVRANFVGRVIHTSSEAWKRKLTELWSYDPARGHTESVNLKFCKQCKAALTPGIQFCGTCGAKP